MNMSKVVKAARKIGCNNFNEFAAKTNSDEGMLMVAFVGRTLHSRKVSDWGREEDTDEFIGLNKSGWIIYTHEIEWGAGPVRIKDENVKSINDEEIIKIFNNDFNLKEQLDFIEKCIDIRKKHRQSFNNLI